ncbi:Hsp20/alpha crystallin family protein [Salirhabdus salicampi]|uniref:Hsp20/alpha crystallin family protein n=1 Tax=Salirhabdus salicampi TaxID=476102 RepID=UPI0020C32C8A|nr:Hsp20/alpha crystallin family protein [Salirhabdus salicampi]MCP8617845.1 Hsp20/alpha crystallin family protein [Salirhabdus salicampi]
MDPFQNMQDWKKNMDRFFGESFWNEFDHVLKPPIPQVNVYQYDNEVCCIFNIPGIEDVKNINVYVDYATLEVRGEIPIHQSGQLVQEEIVQGSFDRKIDLPFPVRSDKIDATYKNGLLIMNLYRLITKQSNKHRVPIKILKNK